MREIHIQEVTQVVKRLFIKANTCLGEDVQTALRKAMEKESSPTAREVLQEILDNARIARDEEVPMCQDTGLAVVFVEMGQDLRVVGGPSTRPFRRASVRATKRATSENPPVILSPGPTQGTTLPQSSI
jgi:fumarate hydratase subunit alpha